MLKSFAQGSQTGLELELVSEAQVLLSIPCYFVLSLFFLLSVNPLVIAQELFFLEGSLECIAHNTLILL